MTTKCPRVNSLLYIFVMYECKIDLSYLHSMFRTFTLKGIHKLLYFQILQDQVKIYATSNPSLPLVAVQFGFWKHNSTCILCHSNVADSSVNSYAQAGNLIFMVNFQFNSADKTAFNTLVATVSIYSFFLNFHLCLLEVY